MCIRDSDDSNLTVLHVGNHLLKCGPLEISTGETIIHIEAGIREMVVFGKLLQDIFLILNAVGIALQTVCLLYTSTAR